MTRTYDAANPATVRTRKQKSQLIDERKAADLRAVLSTPEGRRFLWGMMGHAGLLEQSHRADPHDAAFFAGRRDIACWLYAEVQRVDVGAYLTMQAEAIDQARQDAA